MAVACDLPDVCEQCFGILRMKGSDENPDARVSLAGAVSINNRRACEGLAEAGLSHRKCNRGGLSLLSDTTLLSPPPVLGGTAGGQLELMTSTLHAVGSVQQNSGADLCDGEKLWA